MVQSLHEEQIGVVMDVVFNHVGGDAYTSWFEYTVPGYYFRQDKKGKIADSGTDFGNETASEREMFRKYMIDTVVYWASEYHIDGFRFDLMGCHDVETMNRIREALDKLPGGEKILMYGEPWSAGSTNQVEGILMANQENMKSLVPGIGAFNQPLGMHMNPENRWVRLAEQIPWDVFESKYAELFPNDTGNVAKPLRTALGSLIIQKKLCFSDRELVEQITENPYLQYFIGLPGYQEEPPFDASTLVLFRKHLSPEIIMEANDYILNQDDDKKDPPSEDSSEKRDYEKDQEDAGNEGTLTIDATCAPANIRYPQDVLILSEKNMHNNYLVKQIMDFINSNYEKPLSLHYLSDEFHRSIPYISKLLKQQTDRSFTEILTELRIEKAKNLLKTTSLHINEIGIRIGYPNTRYFSKIFKQKVGMTPNDYRKIIDKFY